MHRGAIAPYWTITHWICHGCSGREGASSRAIARPDAPKQAPPGRARPRSGWWTRVLPAPDIGIATRAPRASAPPTASPRPTDTQRRGRQPPRHRRAAPALARPRLPSPGLACTRPAPPGLARAGGRASCLPPTSAS